jgi:hypothetical protein
MATSNTFQVDDKSPNRKLGQSVPRNAHGLLTQRCNIPKIRRKIAGAFIAELFVPGDSGVKNNA